MMVVVMCAERAPPKMYHAIHTLAVMKMKEVLEADDYQGPTRTGDP